MVTQAVRLLFCVGEYFLTASKFAATPQYRKHDTPVKAGSPTFDWQEIAGSMALILGCQHYQLLVMGLQTFTQMRTCPMMHAMPEPEET
jgi:hypothetical protein